MRYWKCPECKRIREYEEYLIMKICTACQIRMDIMEVDK